MKFKTLLFTACSMLFSLSLQAQNIDTALDQFTDIYNQQLGSTKGCLAPKMNIFRVCSEALKNEGNAPFILHHDKPTTKVVVLFHGLSDSPFYFHSIAESIHEQGFNVVVALLPGHGKLDANTDMEDPELANRWRDHVAEIIGMSSQLGEQVFVGGFSTGGALVSEYILLHPGEVQGLMLFSGALALDPNVEFMAKIWGIQLLAELLDGDYKTESSNPFKYAYVARFAAFELVEVIFSIRELIEQGAPLELPIFSAHSLADVTTPIVGVRSLLKANKGTSTLFEIPEKLEVCHADLVLNEQQVLEIDDDGSLLEEILPCDVPKANPKHQEMLDAVTVFLDKN